MESRTCIEAEPYALQVTDDSMAPEFFQGCVIVVDPTGVARDGAYVLAKYEDRYLLRLLRISADAIRLEPLNSGYPVVVPDNGLASIQGIIVQRAGKRRRFHKRYD